jgi:hypothetical protein
MRVNFPGCQRRRFFRWLQRRLTVQEAARYETLDRIRHEKRDDNLQMQAVERVAV